LEEFERDFGTAWQILALPKSVEHGQEILKRARSKVGTADYGAVTNNCEHFVTWAFNGSGCSQQVRTMGTNVATSAKGGVAAGIVAAGMTTTVTTPYYFLGFIPWGTTSATVPALSTAASVGIGAAAFAGWVGFGLGMSYGLHKWQQHRNSQFSQFVPIAVFNCSDQDITVDLKNLDSSSSYYSARVDDLVHQTRAYFGVGQTRLKIGRGLAGELNPPAEDWLFNSFLLRLSADHESSRFLVCQEVRRGDVLVFRGGAGALLEQIAELEEQ